MTSEIGVSGRATIRSRSERTPTSRSVVVGDVDVVDGLGIGFELAQAVDRFGCGERCRHRDELGRHDPAGGVLGIAQELLDLLCLVLLHEREDLLACRLGQVGDEVGRVVRAHLLEDVGSSSRLEVLEDLDLGVGLHLFHGIGDGLVVERGEDAGAILRRQLVDDGREVGRVELGQAGVGHAELDRCDRALDGVDILPVDEPLLDGNAKIAGQRPERTFDAEPSEEPGRADVDGDDPQRSLDDIEAQVVDTHHPAAVDIDDLLVHEVRLEQDLIGTLAERGDVERRRPELGTADVERIDGRPGQEDLATAGCDDEAGDGRVALANGDDQVGDLADRLAVLVTNRPADRLAQVQHLPPRRDGTSRPGGGYPALPETNRLAEGTDRRYGHGARSAVGTGSGIHERNGSSDAGWTGAAQAGTSCAGCAATGSVVRLAVAGQQSFRDGRAHAWLRHCMFPRKGSRGPAPYAAGCRRRIGGTFGDWRWYLRVPVAPAAGWEDRDVRAPFNRIAPGSHAPTSALVHASEPAPAAAVEHRGAAMGAPPRDRASPLAEPGATLRVGREPPAAGRDPRARTSRGLEPMSAQRSLGARLRGFGRLLAGDVLSSAPLPFSPRAAALGVLGAYLAILIATGFHEHPRFDLVAIPLFVAAALLDAVGAIVMCLAVIVIALGPIAFGNADPAPMALHIVSLTVIVLVALVLRAAVAWIVRWRGVQLVDAQRGAERIDAVLDIARRLTGTFDRQTIFDTIVAEVEAALAADVTTIRICDGDSLRVVACAGVPDDTAARLPVFEKGSPWFEKVMGNHEASAWVDLAADSGLASDLARYDGVMGLRSVLFAPLFRDGAIIGALSVGSALPRHWSPGDFDFVTGVATHASIAIRNAELFERTEGRAAQLAVLQAASARMNRQNTLESVGRAIVEETRRILEYHNARVYVLEPNEEIVPIAFEGAVGAYERVDFDLLRTSIGVGFTGWAAAHNQPLLIRDANNDPRGATIPGTDDVDESMLVVPMRYDEAVVGVITLSKLGLDQFHEDDLRLLTILADQAATALESARLLGHSRQLASELRRLLDMSGELAHSLDPRQVAEIIARHLAGALAVDRCVVSGWDRTADRLHTLGAFPPAWIEHLESDYELAIYPETRRVLGDQVTGVVDVDDPDCDPAEVALLRSDGDMTLVMLPLVAKGVSIGLVEVTSSEHVAFDPPRLELARTMANEAAMALENARLYEVARKLADHDQLTGFYNHRYLHERLGAEIVRAQRARAPLGLLMIDLDDFKLVNDTFGHLFGDRVLAWAAELIRSTLRASDVPARYGGDEFAVILPDSDHAAAEHAAERIVTACRERPFEGGDRGPVPIGLSIGVGTFPAGGRSAQELIATADRALYADKASGRLGSVETLPRKLRVAFDEVRLAGR